MGQPGKRTRTTQDRDSEVEYLDQAAMFDDHVGGLDVSMHDVDAMHVGEHCGDLRGNGRRPLDRWQRGVVLMVENRLQCGAAEQLHGNPHLGATVRQRLDTGVVHGGYAGVLQLRRGSDLPHKSLTVSLVRVENLGGFRAVSRCRQRCRRAQHLDRNPAVESLVIAVEHFAHPTAAERSVHPVTAFIPPLLGHGSTVGSAVTCTSSALSFASATSRAGSVIIR
ncbi:Uncharacterised protein [Mycobacteroides abscessus subsp. abscessus]|nr:Uncharacterised protein [Mycobacteroides abscessus subsp. abscessus]